MLIVVRVNASLYFITERNAVNEDNFIIDFDDTASDYIDLEFGDTLTSRLRYDVLNDRFIFNRAIEIEEEIIDSDGNTGTIGQVLIADGTGKNLWGDIIATTIPYITTSIPKMMGTSKTTDISYEGLNFLPTSTISIPSFSGTINSTTIISPTKFELNVTSGAATGTYDIVVSNNGTLNTQWTGNGENLLVVSDNNGTSQSAAGESCKDIIDNYPSSADGTYWINPDGGDTSNAFEVYCDMTTSGGGWTKIEYAQDLPHQAQFSGGDADRWLDSNFSLTLSDTQINDIRAVSTEGKQRYHGSCEGVIHYAYQTNNYAYAFGFRFHDGHETANDQETYPSTDITVLNDGCEANDNNNISSTDFDIVDVRVPVINVHSRDNSDTEEFGSPLTNYPAWLR